IRNTGAVPMADFMVTDAIPANTTYVANSADASGGTETSGTVVFTGIDVAVGATATMSFSVLVNENLTGVTEISNVALVQANEDEPGTETFPPLPTDPNEPDDTGDTGTDIPVNPIHSVVSWKAYAVNGDASITSVSGGETVEYTIFV